LRGGTLRKRSKPPWQRGLSPLARGNRAGSSWPTRSAGSIPACAGEPANGSPSNSPLRVYPRLRGGTRGGSASLLRCKGLSPLARGNLHRAVDRHGQGGLSPLARGNLDDKSLLVRNLGSIPACAGEPTAGGRQSGP